jgi:hypothetical protein
MMSLCARLWLVLAMCCGGAQALVPLVPLTSAAVPFLTSFVASTTATTTASLLLLATELELTELPPPYVPALFGVALLVGVGLLTGSLGNVMDEESLLGMQSGARAKKEIDRNRSSYFKRK